MTGNTTSSKVLTWALAALLSISSYVAFLQAERVKDRENELAYLKKELRIRDEDFKLTIRKITRDKDSLQNIILIRTDKSYEELKSILDIRSNTSTITIKPKKKT